MKMDFIKVASACPKTKVGDVEYNISNIIDCTLEAYKNEMCIRDRYLCK